MPAEALVAEDEGSAHCYAGPGRCLTFRHILNRKTSTATCHAALSSMSGTTTTGRKLKKNPPSMPGCYISGDPWCSVKATDAAFAHQRSVAGANYLSVSGHRLLDPATHRSPGRIRLQTGTLVERALRLLTQWGGRYAAFIGLW